MMSPILFVSAYTFSDALRSPPRWSSASLRLCGFFLRVVDRFFKIPFYGRKRALDAENRDEEFADV